MSEIRPAVSRLVNEIRALVAAGRISAVRAINALQVFTNFEIGRRIVEHEQTGSERAAYGNQVLAELSTRLTEELGQGFSRSNLEHMRRFYLLYQDRAAKISRKPFGKSLPPNRVSGNLLENESRPPVFSGWPS